MVETYRGDVDISDNTFVTESNSINGGNYALELNYPYDLSADNTRSWTVSNNSITDSYYGIYVRGYTDTVPSSQYPLMVTP